MIFNWIMFVVHRAPTYTACMGTEKDQLLSALEQLEAALKRGLEDRALFTDLVSSSMALLNMDDAAVAGKMPVSRSAVNRWRNGKNVPLPMMRKPVYKFFIRKMRKRAAQLPDAPAAAEDRPREIESAEAETPALA